MNLILVSRCLLGEPVRYDASPKTLEHPLLNRWRDEQRLVPICPELAGGLPCPRPAAEVAQGRGDRVIDGQASVLCRDGSDVTDAFIAGAEIALAQCRRQQIRFALLKARSPSCGSQDGYDGSFSGTLAEQGVGVTAALLSRHGIKVFDESQLEQLAAELDRD
ncbi:DUF523 domain-containing protein [Motiliproteus sp.]|uniref:DUF523 domain-containing protein n=1 Tax=Motiliproteus sp. TaxID=1898955 RepID=UPI003BAB71A5